MLIESIILKAGSSTGQSPLILDKPQFTVIIGPNNSGKSLLIREIHQFLSEGPGGTNFVLDQLKFSVPSPDILEGFKTSPNTGQRTNRNWQWYSIDGEKFQYPMQGMTDAFKNPNKIQNT